MQKANDIQSTILGIEVIAAISFAAGAIAGKIFDMVTGDKKRPRLYIEEVDSWYEGEVEGNYPSGKGTYHYADSSSHSGSWSWAEHLKGTFFGDDMTGTGMFCDGIVYNGSVFAERYEQYDGEWIVEDNTSTYDGYGVQTYPDGRRYEGMWKQGKRHGEGTFTDKSGKSIRAIWENDQIQQLI